MRLQERVREFEATVTGDTKCPSQDCKSKAHSRGRVLRTFVSRHGEMQLSVRRCVCLDDSCGKSFSPACDHLGLSNHQFTPGFADVATMLATIVPHGKAVSLLGEALQIAVSEHAVQDLVEVRGEALLRQDLVEADAHNHQDNKGLARNYTRPKAAVKEGEALDVVYLECDGVFPMTREKIEETSVEVNGARGGKGRKYKTEGREVKNAALYKASDQAQEMPSRGCILERTYVSYLGNYKIFILLVWVMILKLRFDKAKKLVVLSDGCEWIRTMAEWLPLGNRMKLILDLFHAKHRI